MLQILPGSIRQALAIDPAPGSTYLDAEHIVFLMQENRSFDHTFGTLQGVRGYNDPRAIRLPNGHPVWLQSDKHGDVYAPFRLNIKDTCATWMSSLPHSWSNQVDARNEGRFDKWLEVKPSWKKEYDGMPLTLGYHNRADIPFYYALADAFTVCDQNFCSSLTGTTPNRLYFWTGTIRGQQSPDALACVWNEDADHDNMANWTSYPERLEKAGISWKVYQNEIAAYTGFEGEEDSWLGNFTDNPLEFIQQYNVKLHPRYITQLPLTAKKIQATLQEKTTALNSVTDEKAKKKLQGEIRRLEKALQRNEEEQKLYTIEKYNALSPFEKAIHEKAFTTNQSDPDYRKLDTLRYSDGSQQREMLMPKGDVLHQFREDVNQGKLPTVSWLVAPENFSDHPSAAWYGAWYISEVMDILTKNPEVWKKTIFILTYDENDGYFDHVPPFVVPHPSEPGSGKVSKGIDPALEYVASAAQQSQKNAARISPIGLGYRVPMVVASPWSRGGWVNSEVFDHTSSLQFLEHFFETKFRKPVKEENMSAWRRTVCGDLRSVFRPWNGEKIETPASVERNSFLESIHQAQFKGLPNNFYKVGQQAIDDILQGKANAALPEQEKGIRPACALPYELNVYGSLNEKTKSFDLHFGARNTVFGKDAAGAPFLVYAAEPYEGKELYNRNYSVAPGDELQDSWSLDGFAGGAYHLKVYGPNGFYREFAGAANGPKLLVMVDYERVAGNPASLTGNLQVTVRNLDKKTRSIEVIDNSYKTTPSIHSLAAAGSKQSSVSFAKDLSGSFSWYDISIGVKGDMVSFQRFAGRVETGRPGKTDPLMGRTV